MKARYLSTVWISALLLLALGLLADFVYLLHRDGSLGDRLAASAGVLGGVIGAAGAALAVYLTLIAQRKDEAEKVEASLRAEVTEFTRLAIGPLQILTRLVLPGQRPLLLQDLPTLMAMPDPVVFKATADRVSRLPYGALLVTFYVRIAEINQMANIYSLSVSKSFADIRLPVNATGEQARTLATAWYDVCTIARTILRAEPSAPQLINTGLAQTLSSLNEVLEDANKVLAADKQQPPG